MPRPGPFAQPWMLSTAAILTVMTRRVPRHDCLGGAPKSPESQKTTRTILANSWGIESREKLLETLAWLRDAGHRAERDPNAQDNLDERGLLAWDLVRLVAVTGWGYLADFLSEDEAWGFIDPAARELKRAYRSWEDLGQAYVAGTYWWKEEAGPDCERICQGLLSNPASPWRTVPWSLDLDLKANLPTSGEMAARRTASYGIYVVGMVAALLLVGGLGFSIVRSTAKEVKGALSEVRKASESAPSGSAESAPSAPTRKAPAAWDGHSALHCVGSQEIVVDGISAKLAEPVVTAAGSCKLTLRNVKLEGPVAVVASGSAQVTVEDSALTGSAAAVNASGSAKVALARTKLTGAVQKSAGAQVTGQ